MRENSVGGNEEAASSKTVWAYVPRGYDTSEAPKTDSPTLLSTLCCCFSDDNDRSSESDTPVHFKTRDEPLVTLSQALLCVDNPRVPSDLVSYPISEEIILSEHRSQNVLTIPNVFKSTQMMYLGYDVPSSSEFNGQSSQSVRRTGAFL